MQDEEGKKYEVLVTRSLHMSARPCRNHNNIGRRPTRKTTLVSWVSRYHRHFVRLRLSLLASQGESELPEVAQVASQRSDERTHILITLGLAEWQQRARLANLVYICEVAGKGRRKKEVKG